MVLKYIWQCIFSPKLIKVYGSTGLYEPSGFERWGDQVITSLYLMWHFGIYTSPFIAGFMYRRGYFVVENLAIFTKLLTSIGVILVMSLCLRGLGRANNKTYQKFVKVLKDAQENMTPENKKLLAMYDFEFHAWPVEFQWSDVKSLAKKHRVSITRSRRSTIQWFLSMPCQLIGSIAVHTFGLRIIYPGSLSIIQVMLSTNLLEGRSKLIEENGGQRYKLKTRDNNYIDAMLIDERDKNTANSNILVICCEGNAGFYEIGIMGTPIGAGFSVLGWNHPGFAGSTGKPYPEQEQNAIEIVMEFAIHKLKFDVENIVLFGWSIGGYVSSWAAMNYPNIRGLVLDATFDDLLPLAIQHMPSWWESIVRLAIRDHVNLNNYEQLSRYQGPILLIRRTDDEVICTVENNISTNRGNYLLSRLMKSRYPHIYRDEQMEVLKEYLSFEATNQDNLLSKYRVDNHLCLSIMESYISEHSKSYPSRLGEDIDDITKTQLSLFLAQKYLKDYRSTHCTPLPVNMFQVPWDVNVDNDYVFT